MKVKFWGVRGSIPSPKHSTDIRWKLREILAAFSGYASTDLKDTELDQFMNGLPYNLLHPVGGNTSCIEVSSGDNRIILDGGTGLRLLGLELTRHENKLTEKDFYPALEAGRGLTDPPWPTDDDQDEDDKDRDLTILFSHTHWDHIQGFPFFIPAYRPGNRLTLYGRDREHLSWALNLQQSAPAMFPIPLDGMGAQIDCLTIPREGLTLGEIKIQTLSMPHPGGSLAFRVTSGHKSLVYATDYEFPDTSAEEAGVFIDFMAGADVLISDTQYTYLESVAREGWGHSTSFNAMDLAMRAGIRCLFLFHHDPQHSDAKLLDNLEKTRAYYRMISDWGNMRIELAVEGLSVDI